MNRGLYGQTEGNESRTATAVVQDILLDNLIVEGEYLIPMTKAAKRRDLVLLGRLRDKMKEDYVKLGVDPILAQDRADSNLRQAMVHLRLKK